ncbi:MAG: hypothetical protein FJY81_07605 [Candidatus Aminicenantes bacterium]|nr:hypothetical protein [Candidatus Aminicenantes bacterium]
MKIGACLILLFSLGLALPTAWSVAGLYGQGRGEKGGWQEELSSPISATRQETTGTQAEFQNSPYATRVLPDTYLVTNPEAALNRPDGQFAVISVNGFLDLEFSAENGPGDDIAVYAVRSGSEEGVWPDTMSYGLLVKEDGGDWKAVGRGTGIKTPETFELGDIRRIKKIRILFKYYDNPDLGVRPWRLHAEEYAIAVDAVEALH